MRFSERREGVPSRTQAFLEFLLYAFFASELAIVGVAFYAYSLYSGKAGENMKEAEPTLDQLEVFLEHRRPARPGTEPLSHKGSQGKPVTPRRFTRLHVSAFVEGAFVLVLYAGLVAEYDLSPLLLAGVADTIAWAKYLLNDTTLALLFGIFLGILLSELRFLRNRSWRLFVRLWRTMR